MVTEANLLAAIAAAPDDDGPRLVYADWLEERADPRGELIQVQCALARMDRGDARFSPLKRREAALLREHREAWLAPLAPQRLESYAFHRGMVETAMIDSDRLRPALRAAAPTLTAITISCSVPVDQVDVACSPLLAGIRELGLTSPFGITDGVGAVFESAYLGSLERLHLRVESRGARALGDAPRGLSSLELTRGRGMVDMGWVPLLASSDLAAGLTRLRLHGLGLGREGALVFAESARFAGLEDLAVFRDDLGSEGILALFGSPHLAGLRRLTLSNAGIVASEAIARCQWLKRLTSLRLPDSGPGAAAVFTTTEAPAELAVDAFERLEQLDLSGNQLGDREIQALARWPPLARVTRLYLARNRIGDEGASALAASPHLGPLTELLLHDNAIGDEGVAALAAADRLSRLTWLTLGNNRIGDPGAEAIAASPHLGQVTRLTLFGNAIGERGAAALAASAALDPIDLSVGPEVGDAGIARLNERFGAALSVGR